MTDSKRKETQATNIATKKRSIEEIENMFHELGLDSMQARKRFLDLAELSLQESEEISKYSIFVDNTTKSQRSD